MLVQWGATGVDDIFSGTDNFLLAQEPNADPEKLIYGLGERFEVTQTNLKKWTVGSRENDSEIIRQRARINLVPDEGLERLYPQLVAIVEVTLKSGETYSERVGAVRGTVQNPMSRDEITAKCRGLMDPYLGTSQSKMLVDAVLHLDQMAHISSLRPLLQKQR